MTPKEKAQEIYKRMLEVNKFFTPFENLNQPKIVKECALISVNEIITAIEVFGYSGTFYDHEETRKMTLSDDVDPNTYWREVKKEIEKL